MRKAVTIATALLVVISAPAYAAKAGISGGNSVGLGANIDFSRCVDSARIPNPAGNLVPCFVDLNG